MKKESTPVAMMHHEILKVSKEFVEIIASLQLKIQKLEANLIGKHAKDDFVQGSPLHKGTMGEDASSVLKSLPSLVIDLSIIE